MLLVLGFGIALGLAVGWLLPVQRFTSDIDRLHADYKDEYVLMVGNAYLLNSDWPVAEARLAALGETNLSAYVGRLTEQAIAEGRNLNDVRSLVALSLQLNYVSPIMEPYLPSQASAG